MAKSKAIAFANQKGDVGKSPTEYNINIGLTLLGIYFLNTFFILYYKIFS